MVFKQAYYLDFVTDNASIEESEVQDEHASIPQSASKTNIDFEPESMPMLEVELELEPTLTFASMDIAESMSMLDPEPVLQHTGSV